MSFFVFCFKDFQDCLVHGSQAGAHASSFDFGYVLDHTAQIRTIVRISVRVFRFCNHFGQTYMLRTIVRNMPRNGQGAHIRTIVRILGGVVV